MSNPRERNVKPSATLKNEPEEQPSDSPKTDHKPFQLQVKLYYTKHSLFKSIDNAL